MHPHSYYHSHAHYVRDFSFRLLRIQSQMIASFPTCNREQNVITDIYGIMYMGKILSASKQSKRSGKMIAQRNSVGLT